MKDKVVLYRDSNTIDDMVIYNTRDKLAEYYYTIY